jgi:uncharacterized protein (TIGR00288 family)
VALGPEARSLAVFCDFENVALGVKEARYAQFDMAKVLERLLAKGSIVVKKAYCDWERYKEFKATMHSASFELIEIPHVRQSGKNSADIRMVVDALDLCYTKSHVDTFVIVSGDSDFSPLVSKLRENAKTVIGVGVKNSSSDLLINNCDEFIYYDDLVRADEQKRRAAKKRREAAPVSAAGDKGNGGLRPDARHARGADGGARRRRAHLGLDGEAGAEAQESGLQRVVLWLPWVLRPPRGSREEGPHQARGRRKIRRLRGQAGLVRTLCALPRARGCAMSSAPG